MNLWLTNIFREVALTKKLIKCRNLMRLKKSIFINFIFLMFQDFFSKGVRIVLGGTTIHNSRSFREDLSSPFPWRTNERFIMTRIRWIKLLVPSKSKSKDKKILHYSCAYLLYFRLSVRLRLNICNVSTQQAIALFLQIQPFKNSCLREELHWVKLRVTRVTVSIRNFLFLSNNLKLLFLNFDRFALLSTLLLGKLIMKIQNMMEDILIQITFREKIMKIQNLMHIELIQITWTFKTKPREVRDSTQAVVLRDARSTFSTWFPLSSMKIIWGAAPGIHLDRIVGER